MTPVVAVNYPNARKRKRNLFEKGVCPWETRAVEKTSKKAKNKKVTNRGKKQKTNLKINRKGNQN